MSSVYSTCRQFGLIESLRIDKNTYTGTRDACIEYIGSANVDELKSGRRIHTEGGMVTIELDPQDQRNDPQDQHDRWTSDDSDDEADAPDPDPGYISFFANHRVRTIFCDQSTNRKADAFELLSTRLLHLWHIEEFAKSPSINYGSSQGLADRCFCIR